jgi:uncharacterized coiled-coil protein SlyX
MQASPVPSGDVSRKWSRGVVAGVGSLAVLALLTAAAAGFLAGRQGAVSAPRQSSASSAAVSLLTARLSDQVAEQNVELAEQDAELAAMAEKLELLSGQVALLERPRPQSAPVVERPSSRRD